MYVLILNGLVAGMVSHQVECRPLHAVRTQRSWEAGECPAVWGSPTLGLEWVGWRGWGEILGYAQDGRRGKEVRRVVAGSMAGRAGAAVGVIQVVRVWERAGSGSRGCL